MYLNSKFFEELINLKKVEKPQIKFQNTFGHPVQNKFDQIVLFLL